MLYGILGINLIGFVLMGYDKRCAMLKKWRVSEKTLLGTAFCFGGVGVWIGMETFRHKTKHWYFKYLVPLAAMIQIGLLLYVGIIE